MIFFGLLAFVIIFLLFRVLAKLTHLHERFREAAEQFDQAFQFQSSQIATLIEQQEQIIMTVQEVKDRIAAAKIAVQATVTTEVAEVKALISGQAGATPAQVDELGAGVADLQTTSVAAIQSISDQVAGTSAPGPVPLP